MVYVPPTLHSSRGKTCDLCSVVLLVARVRQRTTVNSSSAGARLRAARRWREWTAGGITGRRSAIRVRRADQCRSHRGSGRRRRQARRLLRRRRVGRRLEDDRRRYHLEADLRQADVAGDWRAGRGADQSRHRLGGHRRGVGGARHGHDGRRHLQVDRRRRNVDQRRPRRDRAHRHDRDPPDEC